MEAKNPAACSCHKTKERSEKEYKDLIHRLNRIEGQVRGIKSMVEKKCLLPGYTDTDSRRYRCSQQLQPHPSFQPYPHLRCK